MDNPLVLATDKVMRMMRSMVYLAMCVGCRRGATVEDVSQFLGLWAPSDRALYHPGIVQRSLVELERDGKVVSAGARWYVAGVR
jgi:hypothetical protein